MLKDLIASVVSRFAHEFYVLRLWLALALDIVSEVELDKHKWITLDEPKCLTSSPALIFIQTDPVPDAPEGHRSIFLILSFQCYRATTGFCALVLIPYLLTRTSVAPDVRRGGPNSGVRVMKVHKAPYEGTHISQEHGVIFRLVS